MDVGGVELPQTFVTMKPNRKSIRDKSWDYSGGGVYFITITVRHFGIPLSSIVDKEVELSDTGEVIHSIWKLLPEQFAHVEVDSSVIMPDHFHGIVILKKCDSHNAATKGGICGRSNPMLENGLPRVIRWFKGRSTFEVRKIDSAFTWQSRFFERRIRNQKGFIAAREYIRQNPIRWSQ